jgi:hypothetical protein
MKTGTRGTGTLGGSMENGSYEKGKCDEKRGLERLGGKASFIEQKIINHSLNFADNVPFR